MVELAVANRYLDQGQFSYQLIVLVCPDQIAIVVIGTVVVVHVVVGIVVVATVDVVLSVAVVDVQESMIRHGH